MNSHSRTAWIVVTMAVVGSLLGLGVGAHLTTGSERFEATAKIAIVPAANLPEDLAADFWQVLSEGQIVRTAATIYENELWVNATADELGVPSSELALTASAMVDTTLVEVSVESDSAETSDVALTMVLADAGVSAAEILHPFVISEASMQPAAPARPGAAVQIIGATAVAGAMAGAGIGIVGSRFRRREDPSDHITDSHMHSSHPEPGWIPQRNLAPTSPVSG